MYTKTNYKTKKALKADVADGKIVGIFQPNDMFGNPKAAPTFSGSVTLEGPHYPQAHKWYAVANVVRGSIVGIR